MAGETNGFFNPKNDLMGAVIQLNAICAT